MRSPWRWPCASLIFLKWSMSKIATAKRLLVAIEQGEHRHQCLVQSPAIADPGQRIGADFGKRHQVVRLLADFVVGVGDLGRQPLRGLEHFLGLLAQLLPGGLFVLAGQIAHAAFELVDAAMVIGQAFADRLGNGFQLTGDRFGALEFAAGFVDFRPCAFASGARPGSQ